MLFSTSYFVQNTREIIRLLGEDLAYATMGLEFKNYCIQWIEFVTENFKDRGPGLKYVYMCMCACVCARVCACVIFQFVYVVEMHVVSCVKLFCVYLVYMYLILVVLFVLVLPLFIIL